MISAGSRRGGALGLVLVVLLVMTLLVTALLRAPRVVRQQVPRFEKQMQSIYDGESSIIARLEQLPSGYFHGNSWNMKLPTVHEEEVWPWMNLRASVSPRENVVATVGAKFRNLGVGEIENLRKDLLNNINKNVLNRGDLVSKSGSRRFSGRLNRRAMIVSSGDLTLDLEGKSSSLNFKCDGSVFVKGTAAIDTLRVSGTGNVTLSGNVVVKHLEAFAGDQLELSREFSFSGIAMARNDVILKDRAKLMFPAVAVAVQGFVEVPRKSIREMCGNPKGDGATDKSHVVSARGEFSSGRHQLLDSVNCLLPASVGGPLRSFSWRLQ